MEPKSLPLENGMDHLSQNVMCSVTATYIIKRLDHKKHCGFLLALCSNSFERSQHLYGKAQ